MSSENVTVTINMDRKCAECGKPGAAGSGICIRCVMKCMSERPLKSDEARSVRRRLLARRKEGFGMLDVVNSALSK